MARSAAVALTALLSAACPSQPSPPPRKALVTTEVTTEVPVASGSPWRIEETGGLELRYRLKAPTGSPKGSLVQVKSAVVRRLEALGIDAEVHVEGDELVVALVAPAERVREARAVIEPRGRLEIKRIDDECEWIAAAHVPEEGIAFEVESAPVGPGRRVQRRHARTTIRPGESAAQALARLKRFAAGLSPDAEHEVGFEAVYLWDPAAAAHRHEGWRTHCLWREIEVGGETVRDAEVSIRHGGAAVHLFLDEVGARQLSELTGRHHRRRMAILVDGIVQSAPTIMERIDGGIAVLTMAPGDEQQQKREAERLALLLRHGSLPSPLELMSERRLLPAR